MAAMDSISELARIPMLSVPDLTIYEFLNLLNYLTVKNKKLEQKYKLNGQ